MAHRHSNESLYRDKSTTTDPEYYRAREVADRLYRFQKLILSTGPGTHPKYGWFHYVRGFNFIVGNKADALFLQDLMNLGSSAKDKDGEWFLCTNDRLDSVGWTESEIKSRFRSLVGLGYIKTELRGLPARRWVRVRLGWIIRALDGHGVLDELDPNQEGWFDEFLSDSVEGIPNKKTDKSSS